MRSEEALNKLREGNKRFADSHPVHPHQDILRRSQLVPSQKPFAAILGCADSRVPPEIIFDQGLGDLFVVRVAGNAVDPFVTGSLEYAVDHLGVRLIVVLGHSGCGAVNAALKGMKEHGDLSKLLNAVKSSIFGAVNAAPGEEKAQGKLSLFPDAMKYSIDNSGEISPDMLMRAIQVHAQHMALQLKNSGSILEDRVHKGDLELVSAYYDLQTGLVTFL
jgi:carbonic anhydrase